MVVVSKSTARGLRSAAVALFSVALVLPAGSATWAAIGDQAASSANADEVAAVAARLAAATSRAEIVAILVASNLTKAQAQGAIERAKSSFEQRASELGLANQQSTRRSSPALLKAERAQEKASLQVRSARSRVDDLESKIAVLESNGGNEAKIRTLRKSLDRAAAALVTAQENLSTANRNLRRAQNAERQYAAQDAGQYGAELAQVTDLADYLAGLADQVSASSGDSDTQVAFVNNGAGQNQDGTQRGSGEATGSIAQPNNNLASNNAVTIYVS
ncbi:hypothetical protein [Phenylobacterium conjunctum]|uniref:Uncharacterized protein n=1 Tax=Phenylobacterium conjunctum TaxID=1298959 RepID=A0ABW3T5F2_9CAUL